MAGEQGLPLSHVPGHTAAVAGAGVGGSLEPPWEGLQRWAKQVLEGRGSNNRFCWKDLSILDARKQEEKHQKRRNPCSVSPPRGAFLLLVETPRSICIFI